MLALKKDYDSGDLLRRIREDKQLTQKQLAEVSGFKQPTISQWENGRTAPTTTALISVLDALGYDIVVSEKYKEEAENAE